MAMHLTPVELQRRISRAALRAVELAPDSPQSLRSAGVVCLAAGSVDLILLDLNMPGMDSILSLSPAAK
jgi:CheY-like chemotaxis protein